MNKEKVRLKQELNRLRRQKSILWAGILFLIIILIWTAISIFTSQKKVKIDPKLTEIAKPLVPRLDGEVFSLIEEKRLLSDEELESFPIFVYFKFGDVKNREEGVLMNITDLSIDNENETVEEIIEENNFIEY